MPCCWWPCWGRLVCAATVAAPQEARDNSSATLSNIYLHYAFDLWVEQWRGRHARGDVIALRYADDWVAGFQFRYDAEAFQRAAGERLGQFGLKLKPREDAADRVRALRPGQVTPQGTKQSGHLRLPGVHALLRQDQEGQVHGVEDHQWQAHEYQAAVGQDGV